jgi:hypothetical protein
MANQWETCCCCGGKGCDHCLNSGLVEVPAYCRSPLKNHRRARWEYHGITYNFEGTIIRVKKSIIYNGVWIKLTESKKSLGGPKQTISVSLKIDENPNLVLDSETEIKFIKIEEFEIINLIEECDCDEVLDAIEDMLEVLDLSQFPESGEKTFTKHK